MEEPYDDDDGYNDDEYDKDYPSDPYKWYYKFDINPNTPISNWLIDIINQWFGSSGNMFDDPNKNWNIVNVPSFPTKKIPVNSWNPSTDKDNSFQYLGSNYQGSQIWKTKYFVVDKINNAYKMHLQSHAGHFVNQPVYYKGMFDILN